MRVQQRVHAQSDKLMEDLARLFLTLHELGGLTKFNPMADWISKLTGTLIDEALVSHLHGDFTLIDILQGP